MSAALAIGHVGLTVPDLDAAVAWYRDTFRWELLMGPVEVSVDDERVAEQLRDVFKTERVAFRQAHLLAADGVALELFEFREPATRGRGEFDYWNPGWFHICVVAPEIDELADRIATTGGAKKTAVRPIFPGEPFRFCYCEDPFGNTIELATHPHAESFGGRSGY